VNHEEYKSLNSLTITLASHSNLLEVSFDIVQKMNEKLES